jgi:hypothetical protein
MSISAGLQDRHTTAVNSWRSWAGWLPHTAHWPDPFHAEILSALQDASVRPKTPAYQNISIVISHHVSPPAGIDPKGTEQAMVGEINNALQSKGVIP